MFTLGLFFVHRLLDMGLHFFVRSDARVDAQRSVLRLTGKLSREFHSSLGTALMLGYQTTPAAGDLVLSFPHPQAGDGSLVPDPGTGSVCYPTQLIYYRNAADNSVRRYAVPVSPPTSLPSPLKLASLLASLQPGQSLATEVVSLQALDLEKQTPTDQPQNPLHLLVLLRTTKGESIKLQVFLRAAR